jgi:hypothetical protein
MNIELKGTRKEPVVAGASCKVTYFVGIYLKRLSKATDTCEASRLTGQCLNPAPPDCRFGLNYGVRGFFFVLI